MDVSPVDRERFQDRLDADHGVTLTTDHEASAMPCPCDAPARAEVHQVNGSLREVNRPGFGGDAAHWVPASAGTGAR